VYGHHRRRFKPVAGSETDIAVFPNHYQNIIPTEPDRVWVADITYIRILSGFIYLAVVLDACSRKVIGYALSKRIDTPLALAALTAAYRIRKPAPAFTIRIAGVNMPVPLPGFFGGIWSDRINECTSQSVPQRAGGELYEDAQGRRGLSGRL